LRKYGQAIPSHSWLCTTI